VFTIVIIQTPKLTTYLENYFSLFTQKLFNFKQQDVENGKADAERQKSAMLNFTFFLIFGQE